LFRSGSPPDQDVKEQATAALAAVGLSASGAVRQLFNRIIADQAFVLGLKVPDTATRAAMAASKAIMVDRRARTRETPEA